MTNILNYLIHSQQEIEETLLKLVKAESPSNNKALVDQCGDVLQEEFHRLVPDGEVTRIKKEKVGDQFKLTYGNGDKQILILCHYDTVWDQGALPIKREGNKLFGPGTFDMKGGLTTALWAFHTLNHFGITGDYRVAMFISSDEEIGSVESKQLIEVEARKSEWVYVPESSLPPDGKVKTARKGVGMYKMMIHGIPVHVGNEPRNGVNAIEELALQITDLSKLTNHDEGCTVTVGVVSGGSRSNVKAELAEAEIDLRFMTREQGETLNKLIINRKPFLSQAKIEVTGGINRYPLEKTDATIALYDELKEIAQHHGYELGEGLSGGGSDGNFTSGVGTPTIDGLGPIGDGPHARNEHVVLDNLPYRAALLAEALANKMRK